MDFHAALRPLAGGALIGASASLLLAFEGRVAGICGIVSGIVVPEPRDVGWRARFVLGLLVGGVLALVTQPAAFGPALVPVGTAAAAGLFVGVGTQLGRGCTSGHGVCGISRGSARSIVATSTFMAAAILTVWLTRHVLRFDALAASGR